MSGRIHIIGGGLSGLAAAVDAAGAGRQVSIYEGSGQWGGRCRSYDDAQLGCRIDNGNHLVLHANYATRGFLTRIGGLDAMTIPAEPRVDFIDLETQEKWSIRPSPGLFPSWIFDPRRRVAGTSALDYLSALRLLPIGRRPIARRMNTNSLLFKRLWAPLFIAVLNTPLAEADAAPMWRVLLEIFGRGGRAMTPMVPVQGLSESFIDPALNYLDAHGATVHLNHRLRGLVMAGGRVTALDFANQRIEIGAKDSVILALPASVACEILPDIQAPTSFAPILNAHYRIDPPAAMTGILGVIGGNAEWIFPKPGMLSVTVSAADRLIDEDREVLAKLLWLDVAKACGLDPEPMPPWQIVKEKRATFRATADELARRPGPKTKLANLVLAGDWTATGLPATIEGAIRSGNVASAMVSARDFG
jgi:squalene-associated FAD-dependent desaturase